MPNVPRILALAGSTRSESLNKKLVRIAAEAARAAGAEVTVIDLRDYPMPLYDADLESAEGLPEATRKLRTLMLSHQGLLIASPEYNSSFSAVLKNAIDWLTRQQPGEPPLACFAGKVAAIMSASPGGLGGLRGLFELRWVLSNIRVLVLPDQVAIPRAHEAFDSAGQIRDAQLQAQVRALGSNLVQTLFKLCA